MAAHEDHLESLVRDDCLVHVDLQVRSFWHIEQADLLRQRAVAPDAVDRVVARRPHQPRTWVGRRTVARPARSCHRKGLLGGFLGEVDVAEEADQAGEDTAPLVAEDLLENR
jgi:hypothetical protein